MEGGTAEGGREATERDQAGAMGSEEDRSPRLTGARVTSHRRRGGRVLRAFDLVRVRQFPPGDRRLRLLHL